MLFQGPWWRLAKGQCNSKQDRDHQSQAQTQFTETILLAQLASSQLLNI